MLLHLPHQLELGAFLLWAGLAGAVVTALWPSGHDDRDPGTAILGLGLVAIIGLTLMANAQLAAIDTAIDGLERMQKTRKISGKPETDGRPEGSRQRAETVKQEKTP